MAAAAITGAYVGDPILVAADKGSLTQPIFEVDWGEQLSGQARGTRGEEVHQVTSTHSDTSGGGENEVISFITKKQKKKNKKSKFSKIKKAFKRGKRKGEYDLHEENLRDLKKTYKQQKAIYLQRHSRQEFYKLKYEAMNPALRL